LVSGHTTKIGGLVLVCLLLITASLLFCSCGGEVAGVSAGDDLPSQEVVATEEEQPPADAVHTVVEWKDYSYTFLETWRDRDLNPQSDVVDYGGDYVHLRVEITRVNDQFAEEKAPLQVLLYCKGREYRIFGKDYTRQSYLWRDYTDFPDAVGESHVYIVTMELYPYSRALNTSFTMEEAELALNGMDWSNMEQPQTIPLVRLPLLQISTGNAANP
jgi:hypothetical protein